MVCSLLSLIFPWEQLHHRFALIRANLKSFWLLLAIAGVLVGPAVGRTEETESTAIEYPLFVVNAASVQRLRNAADVMFEAAERKELTDRVDLWMSDTLKEMKGFDRTKPFGTMFYMRLDKFAPLGIMYAPVTNLDDALQTLAYGLGTIEPVEGNANCFEIRYPQDIQFHLLYRDRYLFIAGPDGDEHSLEREFPDPEKLTARLSSQFDIAVSLMIKTIPVGMKTVFLAFIKNQALADLQQRDDEPESVYRLRRANGEEWINILDKVVTHGEELTIGGRMDGSQQMGQVDLEIAGTRDSDLAKLFQSMVGKRTHFGNLLDAASTFTMSASLQLEEKQRKLFVTFFQTAQKDFANRLGGENKEQLLKIIEPIFRTLTTTAEVGHLDAFAQLRGTEQGEFALLAGVKLATSRELPDRISEVLQFAKDHASGDQVAARLDLDSDTIDGYPVHRLPVDPSNEPGKRLFGDNADLFVFASPQAVWCTFGGVSALPSLKEAVAAVAVPQDPALARGRVPIQFVTHAKNWLSLSDDDAAEQSGFIKRAESSFHAENDRLTIEVRPTEHGVRMHADFQSGFVGLMGRGFAAGIENGFSNGPRPGNRGNPRRTNEKVEPAPGPPQN